MGRYYQSNRLSLGRAHLGDLFAPGVGLAVEPGHDAPLNVDHAVGIDPVHEAAIGGVEASVLEADSEGLGVVNDVQRYLSRRKMGRL